MKFVEVFLAGPEEAVRRIVGALIDGRLIACAHTWSIHARYWWQESLESAEEVRSALHLPQSNAGEGARFIREAHPYEVPCILITKIEGGDPHYLDWISSATRSV